MVAPRSSTEAPGLILGVHGYGQPPAALLAFLAEVAPASHGLLVPDGPSSFYRRPSPRGSTKRGIGRGWIADPDRTDTDSRNDALLAAALALGAEQYGAPPERTWLLAYSQGVGVAAHFLALNPGAAAGLIGLAGGIPRPFRPKLTSLAGKPILWVTGTRDRSYPSAYCAAVVESISAGGADLSHCILDADHDLLPHAGAAVADWLRTQVDAPGAADG